MDLIILDEEFQTIGVIPLFKTLIWTRRYEEVGYFELHCGSQYFSLLFQGAYVYKNESQELGIIEKVNFSQDESGNKKTFVKGRFAEALLEDRVINELFSFSGKLNKCFVDLIVKNCIDPNDTGRKIHKLSIGDILDFSKEIKFQTTGSNLSEKLYEIGNAHGISHRIRYDYQDNELYFDLWQGKDRTDSQAQNSWAIFSNNFYNIRNVVYNKDKSSLKNFAYVAGEGEGEQRKIVTVDFRENDTERIREIWVDARDIQSKGSNQEEIDDATINSMMIQRGIEKLTQYRLIESVNSGIDSTANLVYKKDFDLGDICTYVNTDLNIIVDKRITEITEVYEEDSMDVLISFGKEDISSVKKLIKREV